MILRKISTLFILVMFWGCSTKKNTWVSRNYHNLTAYYNVYFNGRESFRIGDKAIVESYANDYTNILPLFESSDPDAVGVAVGDMDRAIEKGKKLIKKHSITAKPKKRSRKNAYAAEFYSKKEFNAWVDDAYVLIGKAQVYKHEQSLAVRTLQHVVRDFPNTESMYEALIWQARAYTDKGDYTAALAALERYDLGGDAPVDFYADYMAVYANLLLTQEKYIEAIPFLKNALTDEKEKRKRLRYAYVLGQLYMLNNQGQEAAEAFGWVAKASTDYEMTFNAKVNQASIVYENANVAEVKKQLHKLRRDKKNKDYLDRIYYAFGKVALQEDDEQEALLNFQKSINASVNNENQKGLSYRESGQIYYSRMDFVDAYFYYDSALTVIGEDYEKIDELKERHYGLSGLVDHLLTVEREDSLQHLADMSEPLLYAYLDGIIAKKEEEQKRLEKLKEEDSLSDAFFYQNSGVNNNFGQTGKWYFYNQASKGMGELEFEKRWGRRKLEDNWRRKDKSKVGNADKDASSDDPFNLPDDSFGSGETTAPKEITNKDDQLAHKSVNVPTRKELLADIPLTPNQRQVSDKKIETALFELGLVFMDRLENYTKSIEALESLLARYPQAESKDEALMALYNAYRLKGDSAGMLVTKNRMEYEFPDHQFVAFLNDPDFIQKAQDRKTEEARIYETTYEAFLFGRFAEVITNADNAIVEDGNLLKSKYLLLRGLSYGKQGQIEPFKADLNTIISTDKDSEEAILAEALLKHIKDGKLPVQGTLFSSSPGVSVDINQEEIVGMTPEAGFVYVENEPYELIIMDIEDKDLNRSVYNVADYNFSRYLLHDFEIQEKRLLNGSPIMVVTGFSSRVEVMDYFYGLRENPGFFGFDRFTGNIIVLSKSNESKFYLSGLVNEYKLFFEKYYLRHKGKAELEKVAMETPVAKGEKVAESGTTDLVENIGGEATVPVLENIVDDETIANAEQQGRVSNEVEAGKADPETIVVPAVTEVDGVQERASSLSIYSPTDDEPHYILIIVKKTRLDFNRLKKNFVTHTRNSLGTEFDVQLQEFGTAYRMIKVDGFKNARAAMAYIESVEKRPYLLRDVARKEHYVWAVSQSNMLKLEKTNEDMQSYNKFFRENYLITL